MTTPAPQLHLWTYDQHDGDYIIAETADEAHRIFTEWMGGGFDAEDWGEHPKWEAYPDDKVFEVRFEADDHGPDRVESQLPAFFCEKYGKGYLCSINV